MRGKRSWMAQTVRCGLVPATRVSDGISLPAHQFVASPADACQEWLEGALDTFFGAPAALALADH